MTKKPTNLGASVQARLLNLARARKEDLQLVLLRYVNERFLYRLAASNHRSKFVLKGAALFILWTGAAHRATRDLDLGSSTEDSVETIRAALIDVMSTEVVEDGVLFDLKTLAVEAIREEQQYGGLRSTVSARVASARVKMQVDIGFGDAVTPKAEEIDFPVLLDFPAPRVRVYPKETVVAEKLEAMVQLGLANSRMKDFFDLALLARQFEFEGAMLALAVRATFARRKTPLPVEVPLALTDEFSMDRTKTTQWRAFLSKTGVRSDTTLPQAVAEIAAFVLPIVEAARSRERWNARWLPGGPWKETGR